MNAIEDIQRLREQVEGTDPVEAQRLSDLEKTLKRAMLTKDLGDNPAVLALRGTLQKRIDLCRDLIVARAKELPTDQNGIIQYAIEQLMRGRTSIVIAHRLSTIQKADKIIVMDRGEIKETGNHEELLRHNGFYAQLYQMQYKNMINL